MIDFAKHRATFNAAKARSRQQTVVLNTQSAQVNCEHEWQNFKQIVRPDNPTWSCINAHFIVRGCLKCHAKRYIGYVVE